VIDLRRGTNGQARGDALANSNFCSFVNTLLGGAGSSNSVSGNLLDLGHNLCSDDSAAFAATTSLNHTDPHLGPFGDNGGQTFTYPLQASSPALDHGDNDACPATDQRGVLRPQGGQCDIGAVEQTFLSLTRLPDGWLQPHYSAPPGTVCILESSEDFREWGFLQQTQAVATGFAPFLPLDPGLHPNQCLRIRMP
jgi:hypothetical protein